MQIFSIFSKSMCFLLGTSILFVLVFLDQYCHGAPVFSRGEIRDLEDDEMISEFAHYKYDSSAVGAYQLERSMDILSADYYSDGMTLFTTVWLRDGVMIEPYLEPDNEFYDNRIQKLTYGVLVDSDSNIGTGLNGVDYAAKIIWTNETGWQYKYLSYSANGGERDILPPNNITDQFLGDFVSDPDWYHYLILPVDLKTISSPTNYRIMFYSQVEVRNFGLMSFPSTISDFTSWINIPAQNYSTYTDPNPLILRQGESYEFGIQLKKSSGSIPNITNILLPEDLSMDIEFDPHKSNKTYFGIEPAPFKIEVPPNAQIGQYVIPLIANISLADTFPSRYFTFMYEVPLSGYTTVQSDLVLTVIEPLSIEQRMKDFWEVWGSIISLVGGGFAAGFSALIIDRFRKKKEDRSPESSKDNESTR